MFCATATLSSCSDFLEIEPQNEIILEKFWNEKADVLLFKYAVRQYVDPHDDMG